MKLRRRFLGFNFSGAEFATELKIPILGDILCFGEAVFLCACSAIFAGEITGALPDTAVRTFVDVNFAAQDVVLFGHRGMTSKLFQNAECERVV